MKFAAIVGGMVYKINRVLSHCVRQWQKSKLEKCGKSVYIGKNCTFTYENVAVGNDVYIGSGAVFQSTHGKIVIGDHVMFGPGVHIHGGNHKFREVGKLIKENSEKEAGEDGHVTIEDDCWIGSNAIILSNVTVGKGSIVGAGAVVTSSIPPYSVYTGVPSSKLRPRFSDEELNEHMKVMAERQL